MQGYGHGRGGGPDQDAALGPFEYRFTPSRSYIRLARLALASWLRAQRGVADDDLADLLVVCSELCTNAIEAASTSPGAVALRAMVDGNSVVLEVEDDGPGFSWPAGAPNGDGDGAPFESGRGLRIVDALTDDVDIRSDGDLTVVRCRKRDLVHA